MTQFESRRREIEAARAQLAFIAAEKRDGVWKPGRFLEKHPIASVFLLDEDRTVTKAYGLHHALATDAINIAHPATLVIDHGGLVRYIYRGENQLDRAPLHEVIGASHGLWIGP
jgi:peroxiredoxin